MKIMNLFAAALAASTIAGSAIAADLGGRVPVVAAVPAWGGLYLGVNAGYHMSSSTMWSRGANIFNEGNAGSIQYGLFSAAGANSDASGGSSWLLGGQIGYNVQMDRFVLGVEADLQGSVGGSRTDRSSTNLQLPNFTDTILTQTSHRRSLDYFGTLRARVGLVTAIPSFMLYATGGLAIGGVKASTTIVQGVANDAGLVPFIAASNGVSATRIGWTAGLGAELKLAQNWSMKAEYLYYDLGGSSYTTLLTPLRVNGAAFDIGAIRTNTRFDGHIFRMGLNYQFAGAPVVVAKY